MCIEFNNIAYFINIVLLIEIITYLGGIQSGRSTLGNYWLW